MKNTFEAAYEQIQEANRAYHLAATEEEKKAARTLHHKACEPIIQMGDIACRIWREYETARDNGNELLDINEVLWDKDVKALITCLRESGIERFTFSSTWTSTVETAWLFLQSGCTLEGMTEINAHRSIFGEEQQKRPAYLFKVN